MRPTDDDVAPEIRLDEAFIRDAPVKEKSAHQRRKEWEKPGLTPRRRRRLGGLRARDCLIPALLVAAVWAGLGFPTPIGPNDAAPASETSLGRVDAPGETTSTTIGLVGRSYSPGQCVTWDQTREWKGLRPTRIVSCDEPHLIEITGRHVLNLVGAYPTEPEWDDIIDNGECGRLAAQYLGGEIDPEGRFATGVIRPVPEGWGRGDREVWCGVQATTTAVDHDSEFSVEFTGAVRSQPQTSLYGAGTCLARDPAAGVITGTVDCAQPHAYEIVGAVDAGARFKTPPPADSGQWASGRLGDDCDRLARSRFGGRLPAGVETSVFPIVEASWRTGKRTTECAAARYDTARNPVTLTTRLLPAP
jgi:hypothetical protein